MKKAFSILLRPEIEAGVVKVVTRDGRPVRIICWDMKKPGYPIIGLIPSQPGADNEVVCYFNHEGSCDWGWNFDLMIEDNEPELTEFESKLAKLITKELSINSEESERFAREYSNLLIDIAIPPAKEPNF